MPTAREDTVRLAELLRREHHAMADFLVALAQFDAARRWEELGYKSLFNFLVRELGLSKGAAFYRNRAAELVRKVPRTIDALRDGRLCLSSVAELANVLTPENVDDVLPRYFHLSRAEAKEVTAELRPDPVPALRTVVTAVPVTSVPAGLSAAEGFPGNLGRANFGVLDGARPEVNAAASAGAEAEAGTIAAAIAGTGTAPVRAEVEPMTSDLRRLHVTVSRRLLEKLAAARDALSHSHPSASDDQILELGLDLIVERHRKRRGIGCKPRNRPAGAGASAAAAAAAAKSAAGAETSGAKAPSQPPSPKRRHVPASVWREEWERDGGRCVWPIDGGGVCGSTRQLELDHVLGLALGAGTTADECRLLCRPHQDVSARALYGDDLMDRFTRPKRGPRCAEPEAAYAVRLRDGYDVLVEAPRSPCSKRRRISPSSRSRPCPAGSRGRRASSAAAQAGRTR